MSSFFLRFSSKVIRESERSNLDCSDNFNLDICKTKKFVDDSILFENDRYVVFLDGIVFNKKKLIDQYASGNWEGLLIQMYEQFGTGFVNELRGSFRGILYDKKSDKWIVYTNHIGDKPIFYSKVNDIFLIGSDLQAIVQFYKKNNLPYSLNEQAAYMLLSYGYVLDKFTLVNEVERLMPGEVAMIQGDKIDVNSYFIFDNRLIDNRLNEHSAIGQLDELFRSALISQFNKDLEYGYKHIATLSGGLDSRMTVYIADELGFKKQLNITFSQSNYLDENVAKKIAEDLKHEWMFKALDNGLFLNDLDDITKISSGNVLYYGLAHSNSILKNINFKDYGILHTGQIGDAVIGHKYEFHRKPLATDGAYSNSVLKKVNIAPILKKYENEELFLIYSRYLRGANQGLLVGQQFTETASPFCDVGLWSFCLGLPLKYRYKHKLYLEWILKKYPKAANYIWEKRGRPLNINSIWDKEITIKKRKMTVEEAKNVIIDKKNKFLGIKSKSNLTDKFHMNPLGYWVETNIELRDYLTNYFNTQIGLLDNYKELKNDCNNLFINGSYVEQNQVLSLLSAYKIFFCGEA